MWPVNWTLALLLLSLTGCAVQSPTMLADGFDKQSTVDRDALTIAHCAERQQKCLAAMRTVRDRSHRKPDFLLPREHDLVEQSLAEYLFCRGELEQTARRLAADNQELKLLSLRFQAENDIQLASLAAEDQILTRALNQSFHRSGIPRGTYDRIVHEVTASPVSLTGESQQRLQNIIYRRGWLLPSVENQVRHAEPVRLLVDSGSAVLTQVQQQKNLVLTKISRIKNPTTRPLALSNDQRQQIRAVLRPGDVLLTYTAGIASNLIIPGAFKHAAIFVGTEDERRLAGLEAERLLAISPPNNQRLRRVLTQSKTANGQTVDVVESLAEGVLLNNFEHVLTSRVNRLAVLRPRLNDSDRAAQIVDALSYVGDEFDFSFDLTDASDQVCTEVAYRSLQGRGGIDIPLAQRAGRLTLTADDLARYSIQARDDRLPCVLMVEEGPGAAGKVRMLLAAEAQQRMAQLLANEK